MGLCKFLVFVHCMLCDAWHNFRTMYARVLKFHIWIPYEKIADTYLSCQDCAPFLCYDPLKKIG